MKKKKNITAKGKSHKKSAGLFEFFAALGVVALIVIIVFSTRSCAYDEDAGHADSNGASADKNDVNMTPISTEGLAFPRYITDSTLLENLYSATGSFPEDGEGSMVENVLAVKLTNVSDRSIEYLTFDLKINEEYYEFSVAAIPPGKSVYAFNLGKKSAPESISSLDKAVEFQTFFAEEPSAMNDVFSYDIKDGVIVVTNISGSEIKSDINIYYKSTTNDGYLGGITYRFRVKGGLPAGESFNAYAPHALTHMTEIMFAQYEE
jgi:hypothetical protein